MSDEIPEELSADQIALLNEESMLGGAERTFCGQTLVDPSASRQRYVKRVMGWLAAMRVPGSEVSLAYAFLLSFAEVDEIRPIARSLEAFESAFDAWNDALPDPVPADQLARLAELVKNDTDRLRAAQVTVLAKPGDKAAPEPPNS